MKSTNLITTAESSPQNTLDDQKKVTENEQIPNSNNATSKIDELLEEVIGDKNLNQLSRQDLDKLLDKVDFLGAIGLDTAGEKIPTEVGNRSDNGESGNNKNSSSTSSLTSSSTLSLTSSVSQPDLVAVLARLICQLRLTSALRELHR